MEKKSLVLKFPEVVRALSNAQKALARHYSSTGLKFTLDGRLVGDIAEALALEYFDLMLPEKRTGGVDALTKLGKKTVQVKATGKEKSGPAFTPGEGFADYLLFFRIDFDANTASVAYNGPEAPVRALLPKRWVGTKVIPLADIRELAKEVVNEEALLPKQGVETVTHQVFTEVRFWFDCSPHDKRSGWPSSVT